MTAEENGLSERAVAVIATVFGGIGIAVSCIGFWAIIQDSTPGALTVFLKVVAVVLLFMAAILMLFYLSWGIATLAGWKPKLEDNTKPK